MTTAWTDGYQTTVNYTYGYYKDLSPNYQKFCLLLNGVDVPEQQEETAHCELGFGQGLSITFHASASLAKFYGTDFNPAHAAHAQQLAAQGNIHNEFYDDSFEELLGRTDLPQFDSISLHGIWSWISHENQHFILQFIRKFLKPNGIVYISYNCVTGWATNMPIRELFHSHFNFNSKSANPLQKVKDALDFSESLLKQNPVFAQRNPNAIHKVEELKKQNPNYLIHEYLNQDWQCFSFQQVVRIFEDIKMSYAGSTDLNYHIDNINLSPEHQTFLNNIEHPIFREQCRDYFTNTQFRRDLFIRGKNQLSPLQIQQRVRKIAFALLNTKENFPKNITGHLGSFQLLEDIYIPIGEFFAKENYRPLTVMELETALPKLNYAQILNALVILCQLGLAQPCQSTQSEQVIEQTQKLNLYILNQAPFHQNYQFLVSPVTGMAVPISHFHQLFYRALIVDKLKTNKSLAEYVQSVLEGLGWFVLDENQQSVSDKAKSLKIIEGHAKSFLDTKPLVIAENLKLFA